MRFAEKACAEPWPTIGDLADGAEDVFEVGPKVPGHTGFSLPIDVILSNTAIVQPDIVYLEPARLERSAGAASRGAPTLAEGRRGVTHAEAG